MTTIATLRIPAAEFALNELFDAHPDACIEVLEVSGSRTVGLTELIYVTATDLDGAGRTLAADSAVDRAELLSAHEGRRLYRVEWDRPVSTIADALLEDGVLLNAAASEGAWSFRLLFSRRTALSTAHGLLDDHGVSVTVRHMYDLETNRESGHAEHDLTTGQYEALQIAQKRGYFQVPREVTLTELADEMGISQQALSERLRRAHDKLTKSVLGRAADPTEIRLGSRPGAEG